MRAQALDKTYRRIAWLRIAGLAACSLLVVRAAHLMIFFEKGKQLYVEQIQGEQHLSPSRGAIVDRDGRELALTVRSASIYAIPKLMKDREATARTVAKTLGLDRTQIAKKLATHESFTYLARWVDPVKADRLRALALEGIGVDPEPRRSYPAGKLAAPLIGFANIDGKGVRGVEQIEDAWLTGKPRTVLVERDAHGHNLALHAEDPRTVEGGEIALTLDAAMQGAAEAALADAVAERGAKGAMAITLDPRTGDVLALAEAPGFDPNRFRELEYADTRARAFTDVVEAGSTMKVFLTASALDNGDIDENVLLDTGEGWIRVPGKTIKDRDPFGVLRPADVLRVSSNVGAVQIAQRMGAEAQHRGLSRFGFGKATGSGFPTESSGLLRDWRRWRPVDQATIAFGQGVSVTPIQLASALAALANDGVRMTPRIVLARRPNGQSAWEQTVPQPAGRALSATAARQTLDMMQTVVSPTGTGRLAGLAGVAVAGKTGTAQKLDPKTHRYSNDRYIAWFVGVVPADDPELAIVVAVDEPKGFMHTGGLVAAPLFARVAAAQLARRGIITEPEPIKPPPPPSVLTAATQNGAPAVPVAPAASTAPAAVSAPPPSFAAKTTPNAASASPIAAPAPVAAPTPIVDARSAVEAAPAAASTAPIASAATVPQPTTSRIRSIDDLSVAKEVRSAPIPGPGASDLPPRAVKAAPPARPAAVQAAGPRSSVDLARSPAATDTDPVFVPDFLGQTVAEARRGAESESLDLSILGAMEGRVVSQTPVAGTILHGRNRRVELRFATRREEG